MAPSCLTRHKGGPGRSPLPVGKVTRGVSPWVRPRVGLGRRASDGLLRHRGQPGGFNPKALSRLISVEGLPTPSMGHHPQTLRRPGPFLRAPGCDSAPNIWACSPEGDPRQADLGRSCTFIPMKLLSQKSNPSCVRCALGQPRAYSSVTLELRLSCARKPMSPCSPQRYWDLGL